jgi:ribosomal protein S6--L-glutamate ligase
LGGPAYIQRFIPIDHDIRVIIIGNSPILAYRREPEKGEFRCNIAAGGKIFFDNIPDEAVALAQSTARKCGFNDVGIDICRENGNFYVLEANMKYGKQGLQKAGIDYPRLMETLIDQGKI